MIYFTLFTLNLSALRLAIGSVLIKSFLRRDSESGSVSNFNSSLHTISYRHHCMESTEVKMEEGGKVCGEDN